MRGFKGFVFTLCACLITVIAFSQQARETFGKNRLQYRHFDWQYLSGENFDIYYYDNRRQIAHDALQFLEEEFDRITDLIGYPPYFKTKVFLYNSLADLRQSNVGLNQTVYTVGGETEFIKPYVEVAHLGTEQEFKDELLYRISDLMVNEMMYGGNLKDIFQSALLMNLPDWFVDGASLYVAKGWSAEMDDYIRQLIVRKSARKINRLMDKEAALAGQSVWNYIAERYGKSSVANILNYTRVTRNEEKSILITLGVTFKQLMNEWQQYYLKQTEAINKSYIAPPDSTRFTFSKDKTTQFTTIKISPDGRNIAYAENDRGHYVIKVRSIDNGREKTILRSGTKVINQRVDYRLPLISWADANTLGVIGVRRGEYVFWTYDLSTNSKVSKELDKFSNVRNFDFSVNGRLVILSADSEGQNDLFLLSTRKDRTRRLTNDIYDDLDASFIPNTNKIVFSSNRISDTLKTAKKPDLNQLKDNYNLFIYDLDSTKNLLMRVTNTLSKDYAPIAKDENNFYYLSDQRGIINVFKYNRSTGIYSQVTNYSTSIKEYDLDLENNMLAMVVAKRVKQDIYLHKGFNVNQQNFTPSTRRKELQQARLVRERKKQESENKNMSVRELLNSRLKQRPKTDSTTVAPADSIQATMPKDTLKVTNVVKADTVITKSDSQQQTKPEENVNTDNYTFEDEAVKATQPGESFLTRYIKARDKSRITGPFPYEAKFSANNLVTSVVIDQLRGFGVQIETQMNDMLEDYRIYGGIMSTVDLRSGDVYAEFQYLPSLIDFSVRFDRKAIRWEPFTDEVAQQKMYQYSLHKLEFGAALPISDRARIAVKPFGAIAHSIDMGSVSSPAGPPSAIPTNNYYGGIKSEIVYDNTLSLGMNLIEGTRGKITYTHYQGLNNKNNSFTQVSADLRHYQKIYKEIVLAVRGFAGTFFGPSPKLYLLGGMDNWAFNKSRYDGSTSTGEPNPLGVINETQDLLFAEFATSVRGFNYATLFGNNVMLMNAEFRVPLIRALTNGPISSNFFRNMQLIAFYDIGTSWSGKAPFDSKNSVSYSRINKPPFSADIKNYLNPWIYSYGAGMRTVILGYYMKFDLAWPVENFEVGKPRFFFTLGFDF